MKTLTMFKIALSVLAAWGVVALIRAIALRYIGAQPGTEMELDQKIIMALSASLLLERVLLFGGFGLLLVAMATHLVGRQPN